MYFLAFLLTLPKLDVKKATERTAKYYDFPNLKGESYMHQAVKCHKENQQKKIRSHTGY